jgi:uncharacterized protein
MARRKKKIRPGKRKIRRSRVFIILFAVSALSLTLLFFFGGPWPGEKINRFLRSLIGPSAPSVGFRMAIIIDDGGYTMETVQKMLGMGKPMTFAILPHAPHARETAVLAHAEGAEVMLHLPMEPREGEHLALENDTIRRGMSRKKIQEILQSSLKKVPHARGVNNHMGSKATEDPEVMQALMEVLRRESLYFVDSHTSPNTVGLKTARRDRVLSGMNYKFLDPEKNLPAIQEAIRLAMNQAKKEGKVIVIGHPHPLTGQAIRVLIPEAERQGIRLVFASEVVE